ncbi:MAG: Hsp20/alpha crystallin family protein [Acidobacteriota bacterium]|nr:Hsp20/alpha crystallin family protein [Acidobacteriota bacterium]
MAGRYAPLFFLSRFQAELDRLFQEALEMEGAEMAVGEWQPTADVVETQSSIFILIELPGIQASDIKVEVKGTLVTLSGNKSAPPPERKVMFHCMERSHGRFRREIQLLSAVNTHRGTAHLTEGLLTLEFPKIQDKRHAARVIPIEVLAREGTRE